MGIGRKLNLIMNQKRQKAQEKLESQLEFNNLIRQNILLQKELDEKDEKLSKLEEKVHSQEFRIIYLEHQLAESEEQRDFLLDELDDEEILCSNLQDAESSLRCALRKLGEKQFEINDMKSNKESKMSSKEVDSIVENKNVELVKEQSIKGSLISEQDSTFLIEKEEQKAKIDLSQLNKNTAILEQETVEQEVIVSLDDSFEKEKENEISQREHANLNEKVEREHESKCTLTDQIDDLREKPDVVQENDSIDMMMERFIEAIVAENKHEKCPFEFPVLILNAKGCCYTKFGKPEKAIELFTTAIKIHPYEAKLYSNRALAYFDLNDLDKALEDAEKALELDPRNTDAQSLVKQIYSKPEH